MKGLLAKTLKIGFFVGMLEGFWELAFQSLLFLPSFRYLRLAFQRFWIPTAVLFGGMGVFLGGFLTLCVLGWRLLQRRPVTRGDARNVEHLLWAILGGLGWKTAADNALLQLIPAVRSWPGWILVPLYLAAGWKTGDLARGILRRMDAQDPVWIRRRRRLVTLTYLGILLGWAGTAFQRTGWTFERTAPPGVSPVKRWNVLILTIDSLRADHVSIYGYPKKTTPSMDAFAQEGSLLFRDCQANATWTKPAVSSMITGKIVPKSETGVWSLSNLPLEEETLLERFHKAGYRTGWFVANPYLSPEFQLPQQADRILVPEHQAIAAPSCLQRRFNRNDPGWIHVLARKWTAFSNGAWYRPFWIGDPGIRDAFVDWLSPEPESQPWIAYLHFMGVHRPYGDSRGQRLDLFGNEAYPLFALDAPPRDPAVMEPSLDAYDADVRYLDACIGQIIRVLRERGDLRRTLVVLTADHGEEFGEHGLMGHNTGVFHRGVTHVPLILWIPGLKDLRRIDSPVQHLDLLPTLLSLTGLPADATLPGADLLQVASNPSFPERPIYHASAQYKTNTWVVGLRLGDDQLYVSKTERGTAGALYHLKTDPGELRNVAAENPRRVRECLAALARVEAAAE